MGRNQVCATPQFNISALARAHGVSRQTIRRWRARGWQPEGRSKTDILPSNQSIARGGRLLAGVVVALAIVIATLAVGINAQAGWHYAASPGAAITFAAMAIVADLLVIMLPTTASRLWQIGSRASATTAWGVWLAVSVLAIMASLGFVERNIGDSTASRHSTVNVAVANETQRKDKIVAAKAAVAAATKAREGECAKRGSLCRDREADERAANAALAQAIAAPIQVVPAVGADDPQLSAVVRLSRWAGLNVTNEDVSNLRLLLLTLVPNLSGIVIAFGLALFRRKINSN